MEWSRVSMVRRRSADTSISAELRPLSYDPQPAVNTDTRTQSTHDHLRNVCLLMTQSLDGVKPGGLHRREHAEEYPNGCRESE